ncbi:hypothetical protein ANTQUA_LOCUS9386 [Anthophora quadrimaculata]
MGRTKESNIAGASEPMYLWPVIPSGLDRNDEGFYSKAKRFSRRSNGTERVRTLCLLPLHKTKFHSRSRPSCAR